MHRFMGILLVAGCCLAFAGFFGYRLHTALTEEPETDRRRGGGRAAVAVETVTVRTGEIRDVRTFTGTLYPRARFVFAPKLGGRLEKLAVNIGDPVTAGQPIARLDDEEGQQEVNRARAALDVARAAVEQQSTELALVRREMERFKTLRDKKIASEAEWDQAEAKYNSEAAKLRVTEAQMAEKSSALKAAEVRLAYTRIAAPADLTQGHWRVEERYVDEGGLLAANTPLVSVVDLGAMTAVIQVIERDYPSISEGLSVQVSTDAFRERSFEGKVIRIAPVLREASRQARVEIEIPNPDLLLRPGMFIRALIEFEHHTDARLVPRTALVKRNGDDGVFTIDENGEAPTARFVPVRVGIRGGKEVEILEPALRGRVVTLGQHMLSDGASVLLADTPDKDVPPPPAGDTERKAAQ